MAPSSSSFSLKYPLHRLCIVGCGLWVEDIMGERMVIVMVSMLMVMVAVGDLQADRKQCQSPLTSLATCFPFVEGKDKTPAQDCCTNLEAVRQSAPKCLCILIRDSTAPAIGLSINTTLALEMPSICKVNANISECPVLLNISPSSPEAKIFGAHNTSSPTGAGAGSGSPSPPSSMSSSSGSNSVKLQPQPQLIISGALLGHLVIFVTCIV